MERALHQLLKTIAKHSTILFIYASCWSVLEIFALRRLRVEKRKQRIKLIES